MLILCIDKFGFQYANFKLGLESKEYHVATFQLNDVSIVFRVAKITPTKIGQFVWIYSIVY